MTSRAAAEIIRKFAQRHHAQLVLTDEHESGGGLIIFPDGKRQFFLLNEIGNVNALGTIASMRDRSCGAFLLAHFGYRAAAGRLFPRNGKSAREDERARTQDQMLADGLLYAEKLGWPVVVKTNLNLNRNQKMTKRVSTEAEFVAACSSIYDAKRDLLIQPFYPGNSYCCIFFDDKIRFVFEKNSLGDDNCRPAIDVTEHVNEACSGMCMNICNDLGLKMACVEIISDGISQFDNSHVVLQVDPSPDLSLFSRIGDRQRMMVERLCVDLLEYRRINGDLYASF